MWISLRAALGLLGVVLVHLVGSPVAAQEPFGDPTRLEGSAPLAVRAYVDWDELITETAGGATEPQFHDAVAQTFEQALSDFGVPLDSEAERFLLCRVETVYDSGMITFAARIELHEPFGADGATAITWHQTWIGTTPVQDMHRLYSIGEQCAADFVEAWEAANGR
ncbi:MAG: hypothetical protein U5R14_09740 [Gemmatimonadota bacterium]|nr:hypothetical protein [Gemmatimonadota bacterium]